MKEQKKRIGLEGAHALSKQKAWLVRKREKNRGSFRMVTRSTRIKIFGQSFSLAISTHAT